MWSSRLQLAAGVLYCAILYATVAHGQSVAGPIGFETADHGFEVLINENDAKGTYKLQEPTARYKGQYGASIAVLTAGTLPESVELRGPAVALTANTAYTFSIWARSGPGGTARLVVQNAVGTWLGSKDVVLAGKWSQYTMDVVPVHSGEYRLTIDVGTVATTYQFDEYEVFANSASNAAVATEEATAVPEPEPEAVPEPKPEAVPEPAPDAVPEPEPEAVPQPEPEAVPQPDSQAVPQPEPAAQPQQPIEPSANPDAVTLSKADATPAAKPNPVPKEEPKPEPEAEPAPEPKEEEKAAPEPEPKPEPKAEPEPEPKEEPKPEPKEDPKPEPKEEPKAEPKAEPETKAEAVEKTAPEVEPKPEPEADPKAADKTLDTNPPALPEANGDSLWEDFESEPYSVTVYIDPEVTATFDFQSKPASKYGQNGLEVDIEQPGTELWYGQVLSQDLQLDTAKSYIFTFYAKAKKGGKGSLLLQKKDDDLSTVLKQDVEFKNSWNMYMLTGQVSEPGLYYYTINFGTNKGAFYFDDIKLESRQAAPLTDGSGVVPDQTGLGATAQLPISLPTANANNLPAKPLPSDVPINIYADFEDGTDGFTAWERDPVQAHIRFDAPEGAYTGQRGIVVDVHNPDGVGNLGWFRSSSITMYTSWLYNLVFFAKANAVGVPVTIEITKDDGSNTVVASETFYLNFAWTNYTMSFIQIAEAGNYTFVWQLGALTQGLLRFDNIYTTTVQSSMPVQEPGAKMDVGFDYGDTIEKVRKDDLTVRFVTDTGGTFQGTIVDLNLDLARHAFQFGTFLTSNVSSANKEWYLNMTSQLFSAITPYPEFEWTNYEPSPDGNLGTQKNFEDFFMTWAKDVAIPAVRGKSLENFDRPEGFWAEAWGSEASGCSLYSDALKKRVQRDVKQYKGRITSYDVFSRLLHNRAFVDSCNMWNTTIPSAFKWAHAADSSAKLCIADYDLLDGFKTVELVTLVNTLKAAGAPIDCISIELHLDVSKGIPLGSMKAKLDTLAATGLELIVSAFDMRTAGGVNDGELDISDDIQSSVLENIISLFFSHPSVSGMYLTGFWDGNSPVKNGGIYLASGEPKPAAKTVTDLWTKTWTTSSSASGNLHFDDGNYKFNGFKGYYQYSYKLNDQIRTGIVDLTGNAKNEEDTIRVLYN